MGWWHLQLGSGQLLLSAALSALRPLSRPLLQWPILSGSLVHQCIVQLIRSGCEVPTLYTEAVVIDKRPVFTS